MSERFGNEMAQLKLLLCQELLQCDCEKTPKIPRNFLIERPPQSVLYAYCGEFWVYGIGDGSPNVDGLE